MRNIAGPSRTTKIAGKIRKTSGKRILIGAFCARSSRLAWRACASRAARLRMICADRDAERLALDRPRGRTSASSGVSAAREHVRRAPPRGEAHALLLQRQPQLLAERAASSRLRRESAATR